MFGYVVAERSSLSKEAIARYRGCYCGLCRSIGEQFGTLQRAALHYDMTFLILLLSSLYEPEEVCSHNRCALHPLSPCASWQTPVTEYAAAMNMALAYHNCMDDWHDEQSVKGRLLAALFRRSACSVRQRYPRQWNAMEICLERLHSMETQSVFDPDLASSAFGALMGELFVWKEDRWAPLLRQIGDCLGRFIYLLDALTDLPKDAVSHGYNPFQNRYHDGFSKEDYLPVLKMLMGECTDLFERLPLLQDVDILRNILYSGVWTGFYRKEKV